MTSNRQGIPFADWSAADKVLWEAGTRPAGLFKRSGAGSRWSKASHYKTRQGLGMFLAFLVNLGRRLSETSAVDQVTQDVVEAYILDLQTGCAPYTVATRIQELYDSMRVLAGDRDWGWLRKLMETLQATAEPVRDKRSRLRPIGEIADLGLKMMAEAEADAMSGRYPKDRAAHYRDGLMIALLAYRPLRAKNFASIRIGQHLINIDGRYWLVFTASEMKEARRFEVEFPEKLVPYIERYLSQYRQELAQCADQRTPPDPAALWISERATPLEQKSFAARITKHTLAAFGKSLSPHLFRDAGATTIAVEDPRHVRDGMHVLGHADLATTEEYYNLAQSLVASRRHNELIASLMDFGDAEIVSGGAS